MGFDTFLKSYGDGGSLLDWFGMFVIFIRYVDYSMFCSLLAEKNKTLFLNF